MKNSERGSDNVNRKGKGARTVLAQFIVLAAQLLADYVAGARFKAKK
jgi:hypothetical protein